MARSDECDMTVVLDRSGSMASIRAEMEGGFNTFITEQRKLPGKCQVTLVQFDLDATEVVYEGLPLGIVPPLTLVPRGLTPLLDAVGIAATKAEQRLAAIPEADRPGKVLFVIITDGQENSSREWTKARLKDLVGRQRAAGWEFLFLGIGIDAFAEGGAFGVAASSSLSQPATPTGVHVAYMAASAGAAAYRSGRAVDLTAEEQELLRKRRKGDA